jgi:hypothetical protein
MLKNLQLAECCGYTIRVVGNFESCTRCGVRHANSVAGRTANDASLAYEIAIVNAKVGEKYVSER